MSSISIRRLHTTILAAAWPQRTDRDVDLRCLRHCYAIIAAAPCDQSSAQSGHGASEWWRDPRAIAPPRQKISSLHDPFTVPSSP